MRLQSTSVSVLEGGDGDMRTVDVCLQLENVLDGLKRELQFNFSIRALVPVGQVTE